MKGRRRYKNHHTNDNQSDQCGSSTLLGFSTLRQVVYQRRRTTCNDRFDNDDNDKCRGGDSSHQANHEDKRTYLSNDPSVTLTALAHWCEWWWEIG